MKKKEMICNGIRISYIEKITDESAPITLFLHGWMSSKESFHLLFHKYPNIIAFDFPSMGESQKFPSSVQLDDFVSLFAEVIKKTIGEKKCNIIVHSFGGRVLLKYLSSSQKIKKFSSLTFIGVPFYRTLSFSSKTQNILGKIFQYKIFSWLKPMIKKIYSFTNPSSDYSNLSDENIKKTFQNIISEDISQYLPLLQKEQVKCIWGENDEAAPVSNMLKAKEIVPNAEIFIIKNSGHFPWVDNMSDFLLALEKKK